MNIYTIDMELEELFDQLDIDPETGEVLSADADAIMDRIQALGWERERILHNAAKKVINIKSELEALKTEKTRIQERIQKKQKQSDNVMDFLKNYCNGKKTDCGVATLYYRKNESVEFSAEAWDLADYLEKNNMEDCIKYNDPTISKAEVKKYLKKGKTIPGVALVESVSVSLR